jgi:hypothetical protein
VNEHLFEQMMLRQFIGPAVTQNWLAVALLVGLLVLATFRPENIRSAILFRLSALLFVLYLVAPTLQQSFWSVALSDEPAAGTRPGLMANSGSTGEKKFLRFLDAALQLFNSCLFAGSVLFALLSVRLTPAAPAGADSRPARRPGPKNDEDDD